MALIATLAEATAMHVIGAMATIAGCCHCDFGHGFCGVARMTIEPLMGAGQGELGLGGMIKPSKARCCADRPSEFESKDQSAGGEKAA